MFWPESFSSFYQFINTEDIQTYILRLFAFQQKNLREAVEVLSQRNKLSSVQSLSRVRLFATPWIAARQTSLSITDSRSSLRLTSIEPVMPSSHLILCRPLLLLPPIPPSIRVFSNESRLLTWESWGLFPHPPPSSGLPLLKVGEQKWSLARWRRSEGREMEVRGEREDDSMVLFSEVLHFSKRKFASH